MKYKGCRILVYYQVVDEKGITINDVRSLQEAKETIKQYLTEKKLGGD